MCYLATKPAVAECPPVPTTHANGAIEGLVAEEQTDQAAVAAQGEGKFIVIFARPIPSPGVNGIWVHRFHANGDCLCETRDPGTSLDDDFCPALLTIDEGDGRGEHLHPSIAMNRGADGVAEWAAAWDGKPPGTVSINPSILVTYRRDFENVAPYQPIQIGIGEASVFWDDRPSAAIGETVADIDDEPWAVGWANRGRTICDFTPVEQRGLVYFSWFQVSPCLFQIESCTPSLYCDNRSQHWLPCAWMRDDGFFVVAHSEPEENTIDPFYDLKLHQYDPQGAAIGAFAGITVNDPLVEQFPSFQSSPAVALVGDQIVVTWIGPGLAGCDVLPFKIYARRYAWNPFGDPTPAGEPFIVNSDPAWLPVSEAAAHPTVAIRNAPGAGPNHFAILWNVKDPTNTYREIHAQYFSDQGSPIGGEVRVNQADVESTVDPGDVPGLAGSAQHTAAFTPYCALVSVWTTFPAAEPGESKVYFTILPADHGLSAAPGLFCA